jgi:hypothetical protein
MAKVQYSAVVGDARGKIGGNVATKGRFGAVMRRKVSPVQPRSAEQRSVRSRFTNYSKGWSGLATDALRVAWEYFAKNNPLKDTFGNTVVLTGHQMYVRLNAVLDRIGGTPITAPPLALTVAEPGELTVTAATGTPGTLDIAVTNEADTRETPEVWAAPPQNPGRKFIGGKYRLISVQGAHVAGPYHVGAAFEAKYGAILAGQTIHVLVKFANVDTGAQGLGNEGSATAT